MPKTKTKTPNVALNTTVEAQTVVFPAASKTAEDIAADIIAGIKDTAASLLMMEDAAKENRTDKETASGAFTRLYFHAIHLDIADDVQSSFVDGQWKRLKAYASHGKYLYDQIRGDGRINVANPDGKKSIIIAGDVVRILCADHIADIIAPKPGDSGIRTISNAVRAAIKAREEKNATRTDATDKAISAWIRHGKDAAAIEARTDGEDVATVKAYRAAELSQIIADGIAIIAAHDAAEAARMEAEKTENAIVDALAIIANASADVLARFLTAMERRAAEDAAKTATDDANKHAAEGVASAADRLFAVAS
jgi:hypothetical protein